MKKIVFIITLFLSINAFAKTQIEYIVDFSGSMKKSMAGQTQIDAAKSALFQSLNAVPQDVSVAIRLYGHRVEQSNKDQSCQDSVLEIPFGSVDVNVIKAKMSGLTPKGYTPIAYSLEQAAKDFPIQDEAQKTIILLSDGEETCGGDPVAVVKKLKAQGIQITINTIGFNVDSVTRQQLEAIAKEGNGQYFNAGNVQELNQVLKDATQKSLVIEKKKSVYGQKVRGGDSYETAVQLPLNVELKLDHHQRRNEFDFFYVDLKPGNEFLMQMITLTKGIKINTDGSVKENHYPYGGVELHDPTRAKIKRIHLYANKNNKGTMNFISTKTKRYYVLVGSTNGDMHADEVVFKATIRSKGDLGRQEDAGSTFKESMSIVPGRYEENYIQGNDKFDMFTFKGKKGEQYFIGVIPESPRQHGLFKVKVYDEYRQRLISESSQPGAGLKTKTFKIPSDGSYYIEISQTWNQPVFKYAIHFQKVEEE